MENTVFDPQLLEPADEKGQLQLFLENQELYTYFHQGRAGYP